MRYLRASFEEGLPRLNFMLVQAQKTPAVDCLDLRVHQRAVGHGRVVVVLLGVRRCNPGQTLFPRALRLSRLRGAS